MKFEILPERPQDAVPIEALLDRTFGPDRGAKTVYRLREAAPRLQDLSFVALDRQGGLLGGLLGALRFWPIRIGPAPALLLGPLAVAPELQGRGVGRALLRHGLDEARRRGHRICVVVGAPDYYAPYGFARAASLVLPGPVEPRRFLVAALAPGALDSVSGPILPANLDPRRRGLRGRTAA